MNWSPWIALLSFSQIFTHGQCHLSDNPPPYIYVERNWQIPDNETIGSRVAQVHRGDAEGGNLTYGLEPVQFPSMNKHPDPLPFNIDPYTGMVYLNDSLKGKAGKEIHVYVTLSDGELVTKTEVYVNILNSSSTFKPVRNGPSLSGPPGNDNPMVFDGFSEFNVRPPLVPPNMIPKVPTNMPKNMSYFNNPTSNITNNAPSTPHFQQKTYPDRPKRSKNNTSDILTEKAMEITTYRDMENEDNEDELNSVDYEVKSPELSGTVGSIVSVCAVFCTVGIVAVIFRKRIAFGKPKDTKDDMRQLQRPATPP